MCVCVCVQELGGTNTEVGRFWMNINKPQVPPWEGHRQGDGLSPLALSSHCEESERWVTNV